MQGVLYHVKRLAETDKSMQTAVTAVAKAAALVNLAHQATASINLVAPCDPRAPAKAPQTQVKATDAPTDSSSKAMAATLAGQEALASTAAEAVLDKTSAEPPTLPLSCQLATTKSELEA